MATRNSFMNAIAAAIVDGNVSLFKRAEIMSGVDLGRLRGSKGRNLLLMAVAITCRKTSRLDVIRYLVEEKGFDVNSASTEGETAIFVATDTYWVVNGSSDAPGIVPLLNYFLGRGVDPAAPDAKGCTPLHNAAEYGHNEAIELLLSRGIPVDPLDHRGTPLHVAAANGHAQALKILLDHGADPNKVANRVCSPLLLACYNRTPASLECVKLLVEDGADVNFHRPPGVPMLTAAVIAGSAEIVNFLLAAGADPNIHDGYGAFPIMQAAIHGRRELVEILLPRTNPIPSLPDWTVDGVIGTMKTLPLELFVEPIANAKSEGKEAFANGDYGYAINCFLCAKAIDPHDATILANLSLCYLKLREGKEAVSFAKKCQMLRPGWAKAWFREGEAKSLLQLYDLAVHAFEQALKLDPANEEIKKALREAREAAVSRGLPDADIETLAELIDLVLRIRNLSPMLSTMGLV